MARRTTAPPARPHELTFVKTHEVLNSALKAQEEFLRIEIEIGMSHVMLATTERDIEKRRHAVYIANQALQTAKHFLGRLTAVSPQPEKLEREVKQLEAEIDALVASRKISSKRRL